MAAESSDVETWVRKRMAEDVHIIELLGGAYVFNSAAPPRDEAAEAGAPYPDGYVLFNLLPLDDLQGQGGHRINSKWFVDIAVVTDGAPTANSESAVARIDLLFKFVKKASAGAYEISARRWRPINYRRPGARAERYFLHRGGTYKLWVTAAP
jgi:hypothetical protein